MENSDDGDWVRLFDDEDVIDVENYKAVDEKK